MRTLDQLNLSRKDRTAVDSAAKLLRAECPVDRLVLFGSTARGESQPESDIDLLVLTNGPMDRRLQQRVLDLLYPIELDQEAWFGLLFVSSEDWNHGIYQAMPIRGEIDRDGVEV